MVPNEKKKLDHYCNPSIHKLLWVLYLRLSIKHTLAYAVEKLS